MNYTKITSIEFTIKNQDKDFIPTVKAYLEGADADDYREITLEELKAGDSYSEESTKLALTFDQINVEKTVVLELYNEKDKLLKKVKSKQMFS
jgi:hypothetical protein